MKYLNSFIVLSVIGATGAAAANPMFGADHRNAISLYAGQSTGPGSLFKLIDPFQWDITPMTMGMFQYSQPMTLFRLPARQNINVVQNVAYGHARGLSFLGVGVSWDVALIDWCGWYLGGGIGPYMRDSHDRYVASRLVFGEKFFVGYQIHDALRAEFFTLHFSNGDFTEINRGFNFTGLGVSVSF
ncbi:acyloxyacyl hydrolase [bacterium]|nr:acyloxyacyl hydrolase [bacterium]